MCGADSGESLLLLQGPLLRAFQVPPPLPGMLHPGCKAQTQPNQGSAEQRYDPSCPLQPGITLSSSPHTLMPATELELNPPLPQPFTPVGAMPGMLGSDGS